MHPFRVSPILPSRRRLKTTQWSGDLHALWSTNMAGWNRKSKFWNMFHAASIYIYIYMITHGFSLPLWHVLFLNGLAVWPSKLCISNYIFIRGCLKLFLGGIEPHCPIVYNWHVPNIERHNSQQGGPDKSYNSYCQTYTQANHSEIY